MRDTAPGEGKELRFLGIKLDQKRNANNAGVFVVAASNPENSRACQQWKPKRGRLSLRSIAENTEDYSALAWAACSDAAPAIDTTTEWPETHQAHTERNRNTRWRRKFKSKSVESLRASSPIPGPETINERSKVISIKR